MTRIKFAVSKWDQLNWYVQFASKPIKQLSPGERLSLCEEARAIERTLVRRITGAESVPELSDGELQRLHAFYREKLMGLAIDGQVALGPFELHLHIMFGLVNEDVGGKGLLGSRFLTYHFARLLTEHPNSIAVCPHCKMIFLRFRRNALYCSRVCQSVAVMRKLRGAKMKAGEVIRVERKIQRGRAENGKTRR